MARKAKKSSARKRPAVRKRGSSAAKRGRSATAKRGASAKRGRSAAKRGRSSASRSRAASSKRGRSATRKTASRRPAAKRKQSPVSRVKRVTREVVSQASGAMSAGVETLRDFGENLVDRVRTS